MFDITNYNLFVVLYTFLICFLLLYFLFKNKFVVFFDPLVYHLIWLSSHFAFFVAFLLKYGFDLLLFLFIIVFCEYVFFLFIFIKKINISNSITYNAKLNISDFKLSYVFLTSVFLIFISKIEVLSYLLTHNLIEWPLYRFVRLQEGNPILKIIEYGVTPIYFYLTFYILFLKKNKKLKFASIVILFYFIFLGIVSGGRSMLISLVLQIGTFVYFHRMDISTKMLAKLRITAFIFILFGLVTSSIVSYFYIINSEKSLIDGFSIIFNRIFANADGLEYYLLYDGYSKIESGLIPFIYSFLGIYLKRISDTEYKNIGHQLTELVIGPVDFAQGSNYTIFLQSAVIGFYLLPIYIILLTYLIAKMRNLVPSEKISINLLKYFFVSNAFIPPTDLEFFTFNFLSFMILYIFIFFPILKLKIIKRRSANNLKNSNKDGRTSNESFGLYGNI